MIAVVGFVLAVGVVASFAEEKAVAEAPKAVVASTNVVSTNAVAEVKADVKAEVKAEKK
jgi:hypothetical protein